MRGCDVAEGEDGTARTSKKILYCGRLFVGMKARLRMRTDREAALEEEEDEEEEEGGNSSTTKGVMYLVAGGLLIIFFATPFIDAVVEVSSLWNVSPTLLAFFLAPIASEAPEILESVSLSRKGGLQNINIAYSNLIGGTITKTTLLVGVRTNYMCTLAVAWPGAVGCSCSYCCCCCVFLSSQCADFLVLRRFQRVCVAVAQLLC